VVQQIERVATFGDTLLYAYNQVVTVNQPTTVHASGGLPDTIDLNTGSKKYTVVSIVPGPSAQQLQTDSTAYPAWLAPYLAKPNVPSRVTQLAQQWAGTAGNPYDKAMNIEGELRKIPYTTDITPPPSGQDAVDYFPLQPQARLLRILRLGDGRHVARCRRAGSRRHRLRHHEL